jgi:hypothetical protein
MIRRTLGILCAALTIALLPTLAQAQGFFQGFENNTNGWFNLGNGAVSRAASRSSAPGGYADDVLASSGNYLARLSVDPSANFGLAGNSDCKPGAKDCIGPYVDWGLGFTASRFPRGGTTTEVDVYLDTAFAGSHPDYRFDWDSALNDSTGNPLQDYVINAGTGNGQINDPCGVTDTAHFVVAAGTNATREASSPEDPNHGPQCINSSGWYTFRDVFKPDSNGDLEVDLSIVNRNNGATVASWTLHPTCALPQSLGLCTQGDRLPVTAVGGNAYGWFPNQEINGLAIDNSQYETLQPQTKSDCLNGGWALFSSPAFQNEDQCLAFLAAQPQS